jgi:hypothetical protein
MQINSSISIHEPEEIELLLATLADARQQRVTALALRGRLMEQIEQNRCERAEVMRQAAADQLPPDSQFEIDDGAPVSLEEDGSAYVQAWMVVANPDAAEESALGIGSEMIS